MSDVYRIIMSHMQRELVSSGISTGQAAKVSAQTVDAISMELGGQSLYLPRRTPWFSISARNRAIRQVFNGRNMQEVCRRFRVSSRTVYRASKK